MLQSLLQHTNDPGWAFVLGARETEFARQGVAGGATGDDGSSGMRNRIEHGPHGDHRRTTQVLGALHDAGDEGWPVQMRLHPGDDDEIATISCAVNEDHLVLWPTNVALFVLVHPHFGSSLREVEERIGFDIGHRDAVATVHEPIKCSRGGFGGIEPALQGHQHDRPMQLWNLLDVRVEHFLDGGVGIGELLHVLRA